MARATILLLAPLLLVVGAAVVAPAGAADHVVGGSAGWYTTGNYDSWAASETFAPGDTLTFNYGGFHSVSQVSKPDYESCSAANSIKTDSSGATTFTLDRPNTSYYFICGTPGHCSMGMKLAVATTGAAAPTGSIGGGGSGAATNPPTPPRSSTARGSVLPSAATTASVSLVGVEGALLGLLAAVGLALLV